MVSLTKQEPVEKEPSYTTASRRPQPLHQQPRSYKGPFKRKPNNHSNSSLPFCNNHHAPQRTCHAWCRSRERKTTKERKNFFSFPLLELANAQPTSARHPFPSFRINIKLKNFRACVLSLGEKTTTRRKTKKLFRNFDSCCFLPLVACPFFGVLENTEQFRFLI